MATAKHKYAILSSALYAVALPALIFSLTIQFTSTLSVYAERDVLAEATKFKMDGKIEKALKLLEQALKKDKKDDADVHFLYATLLETTGDLPGAKLHFKETLRLDPQNGNAENARKEISDIDNQLSSKNSGRKAKRPGTIGIKVQEGGNIVKVFANTPAAKANIQAGDKIISADDAQASGMSIDALVHKIRGPENSNVKLVIERNGKRTTYQIKRASPEAANKEASKPFWFLFGSKDQG